MRLIRTRRFNRVGEAHVCWRVEAVSPLSFQHSTLVAVLVCNFSDVIKPNRRLPRSQLFGGAAYKSVMMQRAEMLPRNREPRGDKLIADKWLRNTPRATGGREENAAFTVKIFSALKRLSPQCTHSQMNVTLQPELMNTAGLAL